MGRSISSRTLATCSSTTTTWLTLLTRRLIFLANIHEIASWKDIKCPISSTSFRNISRSRTSNRSYYIQGNIIMLYVENCLRFWQINPRDMILKVHIVIVIRNVVLQELGKILLTMVLVRTVVESIKPPLIA